MGIERDRLDAADPGRIEMWRRWGPYASAREWGTVREDYSADGDAWRSFTYDEARSRAYRWGEDGLAAVCDVRQNLCVALTLWNGRDPHLKERLFGLTGPQGNHGEDVKEYWWHLDAVPSHAWLQWRYHYPHAAFPYDDLVAENARRGFEDPEYELVDTGVFADDRFFAVTVTYAKADPGDLCVQIVARNEGPVAETVHLLPTLWFRNTWTWDGEPPPVLRATDERTVVVDHPRLPAMTASFAAGVDGPPRLLFCDNETNVARLYGAPASTAYPKDGINDHVVSGAPTVNPDRRGTKAAAWYSATIAPGAELEVRFRLTEHPAAGAPVASVAAARSADLGAGFDAVLAARRAEADEFHHELAPEDATDDERLVLRQAVAGLLWSQQLYRYNVGRWLDGDPLTPPPPAERLSGRNSGWRHVATADVLVMPDTWEYPWFASWDLAFHCVSLAHVDAPLAKDQLLVLLREWYMHPNGQLPAYEWAFGDVNPPVHAWAALRVFEIDGRRDLVFLRRIFHKLLLNFTWWVNRKDAEGNNVFEGGFLGLDNIGPFNRSEALPVAGLLEQSDATGWMAMYCLNMLEIAVILAQHDHVYEDLATKFLEHFAIIAEAMESTGLWDEDDGFFYDVVRRPDGSRVPVRVRSMVGLVPLFAMAVFHREGQPLLKDFLERARWFIEHRPRLAQSIGRVASTAEGTAALISVVSPERLQRVLKTVLDPDEFLSPHGLRSLSLAHRDQPATVSVDGLVASVDYEPGESRSGLFGGNSNWRGPVWFPLNFLIIEALRRYHVFLGEEFTVEFPTGSGQAVPLGAVADALSDRLVSLFLDDADGRRPVFGAEEVFQRNPRWHGLLPFSEYFHGDTGAGLGASHQTGWTALVADLIASRRFVPDSGVPGPGA